MIKAYCQEIIYFDFLQTLSEMKSTFALREKCPYSEFFWSVFSPNTGKYRPEKFRIRTLFKQCRIRRILTAIQIYLLETLTSLTHFGTNFTFYTTWNHQKTHDFVMFPECMRRNIGFIFWCFQRVQEGNIGSKWVNRKRYVFKQFPIILLIEDFFSLTICYKRLLGQEPQKKCKITFIQQNFTTNVRIVCYLIPQLESKISTFSTC